MTIYLAGNEVEILTNFAGASAPVATTSSDVAIAGVNRAGFELSGVSAADAVLSSPITEGWVHVRIGANTGSSVGAVSTDVFALKNAEGQNLVRIYDPNSGTTFSVQILSGTVISGLGPGDYDIYFKLSATVGACQVYREGALITEISGNVQFPSGTQSLSKFTFRGRSATVPASLTSRFAHLIVANTPTIGARVHTLPLTVSTPNNWTGTPANVTGTASAGTISETTVNDEINFSAADFGTTLQDGFGIDAVVISSKAQALTGSPVTRLQGRSRVSGTPYDVGGSQLLGTGVSPVQHIVGVNPATSTAWTVATVNAAEFGVQAKA